MEKRSGYGNGKRNRTKRMGRGVKEKESSRKRRMGAEGEGSERGPEEDGRWKGKGKRM
jgi:hypothetical protein